MSKRLIIRSILGRPALFCGLVLAGEEIPDLFQKLSSEHPHTDAFLREVNRYHRQEEARHLALARTVLPELWDQASWWERFRVRWHAPLIVEVMFDMLVHPDVYEAVGLPRWCTWWATKQSEGRLELRHRATRPIAEALAAAGAFPRRAAAGAVAATHRGVGRRERSRDRGVSVGHPEGQHSIPTT